jgi:hypothetical protein
MVTLAHLYHVLADVVELPLAPVLEPLVGPLGLVVIFFVVILLEGAMLHILRWDRSFARCLIHAVAINTATTLIGLFITMGGAQPLLFRTSTPQTVLLVFGVSFVISALIEGVLLRLLKRDGAQPLARSLIINIASYILLFALAIWALSQ